MAIRIACPRCHEPLEVPDYASGRVIQCPACRALSEAPMAFRPKPPPRVKQGPSELDDLTKTFQNLYSNPLPNLSLFLSCLAILFFMRPSHALIIGGLTICIGLYGRNSVELNPSGADKEQKKAKSLEIKKFDAAITVSSIAIALALLLSWFGR